MKNTIYAVEETLWEHERIVMIVAKTALEAREKAKRLYGFVVPKAFRLPLSKGE